MKLLRFQANVVFHKVEGRLFVKHFSASHNRLMHLIAPFIECHLIFLGVRQKHTLRVKPFKAVKNNIECRLLLRNHKHPLVFCQCVGNYVDNGLRFTRARRSVNDDISAFVKFLYGVFLRIVKVVYCVKPFVVFFLFLLIFARQKLFYRH